MKISGFRHVDFHSGIYWISEWGSTKGKVCDEDIGYVGLQHVLYSEYTHIICYVINNW